MKSRPTVYIQSYIFIINNILILKWLIDFRGINKVLILFKINGRPPPPFDEKDNSVNNATRKHQT